jgi:hypothetical protein
MFRCDHNSHFPCILEGCQCAATPRGSMGDLGRIRGCRSRLRSAAARQVARPPATFWQASGLLPSRPKDERAASSGRRDGRLFAYRMSSARRHSDRVFAFYANGASQPEVPKGRCHTSPGQAERRPGLQRNNLLFFSFWFAPKPFGANQKEKKRLGGMVFYPGRRPRRPCRWAGMRLPLWGVGEPGCSRQRRDGDLAP